MTVGLLMSGQGAQKAGMGVDLYETHETFKSVIDQASQILGYNLVDVFNDEAKLAQTRYTQPAIVAMSLAIYQSLKADGALPEVAGALGLSLGEYSALVSADVLTFEQAIAIIADRGEYMQVASEANPGKMVAILGDNQAGVLAIIKAGQEKDLAVYPANFNTFQQLVIGGKTEDIDQILPEIEALDGIKRLIELPVAGAFHTGLMADAGEQLDKRIADESFSSMAFPVYSNTTGKVFEDVKTTLLKQIVSPTYFAQALDQMVQDGVDTFIELGPGDALMKFAKKIAPSDANKLAIYDVASYEKVKAFLQERG